MRVRQATICVICYTLGGRAGLKCSPRPVHTAGRPHQLVAGEVQVAQRWQRAQRGRQRAQCIGLQG